MSVCSPFYLLCFVTRCLLCSPDLPGAHNIAQAALELAAILLPQSPKCWDSSGRRDSWLFCRYPQPSLPVFQSPHMQEVYVPHVTVTYRGVCPPKHPQPRSSVPGRGGPARLWREPRPRRPRDPAALRPRPWAPRGHVDGGWAGPRLARVRAPPLPRSPDEG